MKKTISCILILILLFSLFGCKAAPEEESAVPLDTAADVQTEVQQEQQTEVQDKQQTEQTGADAEQVDEFDFIYSEYEILVTLTPKESQKEYNYTTEDFKDLQLSYVYKLGNYNNHFKGSQQDIEKYKNKVSLVLFLNDPQSQSIDDAISILQNDDRVFWAEPNTLEYNFSPGNLTVYTEDEVADDFLSGLEDIANYQADSYDSSNRIFISIENINSPLLIKVIKFIEQREGVLKLSINYSEYYDSISVVFKETARQKDYDISDFQVYDAESIESKLYDKNGTIKMLRLKLKNPTPYNLRKCQYMLNNDDRIETSSINQASLIFNL